MLNKAVAGNIITESITWAKEDGTVQDLTDLTLTGTIQPVDTPASIRAIAGTLTITNPTSGVFTWTFAAADVVAGLYMVQFKATAGSEALYTFADYWIVEPSGGIHPYSLAGLRNELMALISARNLCPNVVQYTLAVQDAVADYSDRKPLRKSVLLNIVDGTASYDLPADFLTLISLETPLTTDGVLISDNGLIPVGETFREETTIAGGQITFIPTPRYSATKRLWYGAAYVPNSSEVYADMSREVKRAVILKAQANALQIQANKAAQEAWQYAIGDERVNKEKLAEALGKQAKAMNEQYEAAVRGQQGIVGMRSYYGLTE